MGEPQATVTYWGISVLNSKTYLVNGAIIATTVVLAVAGVIAPFLDLAEVKAAIPTRYALAFVALTAIVNLVLRTYTVRPVAFIPHGETIAVPVPKIAPPAPPLVSD